MSSAIIETRSSTDTGTRAVANRPGSRPFALGESSGRTPAFLTGMNVSFSPAQDYPLIARCAKALIDRRRQYHFLDDVGFEIKAEITKLLDDWWRGIGGVVSAHDFGHVAERFPSASFFFSSASPTSTAAPLPRQTATEPPEEAPETIDWDVRIETVAPRRSEWIAAEFVEGSYRKPRIVDDPED